MVGELLVYDDLEPKPAPLNMAVDEALLVSSTTPILRFYRWQRPAVSFAYFGFYADVKRHAGDRQVVRRWPGRGIGPLGEDLTYAIILPSEDPLPGRSSSEI